MRNLPLILVLKQTVQFVEITQHIFCPLIIGHAFWREFDPPRGALEKLGAKLMFQCLYLARNTSLWQSKEIRCAGKTFQLSDFDEQLHCVNFIHFFDQLLFTAKQ